MSNTVHVLLAEDDADLRVTTRLVLERRGFEVTVAADGQEAFEKFQAGQFDVGLFDVMMPRMDGLTLVKKIRAESNLPIVLLTARDLSIDQVVGLEAGADDYVVKPFDSEVLSARLRAVLRRASHVSSPDNQLISVGELKIDLPGMIVYRDGEELDISATEFRLLSALLEHAGAVLSRRQLMEQVWGSADWSEERIVDVNVQRLRAKIGNDVIVTVRGAGYKMVRPA